MEVQNKKPFSPQRGPFQIRLRCLLRVDNIFTMQHLHCTLFLAMQGTCSSGISPGLCSMFTFIFDHFNSKRSFLGSGYKYQNSHCEEEFKYSEFTFKALVENHCKKFCSCLCLLSCKEKQNHKTLRNKACLQPCPCLDQVVQEWNKSFVSQQLNVFASLMCPAYLITVLQLITLITSSWRPGSQVLLTLAAFLSVCCSVLGHLLVGQIQVHAVIEGQEEHTCLPCW